MMNVREYAEDIDQSIESVLSKAKDLGIEVSDEESMLDEDAIIILDNAFDSNDEDGTLEEEDLEEIIERNNIKFDETDFGVKKIKSSKDDINQIKEDIDVKKKAMYKNKKKLMSNTPIKEEGNVVYYGDGLSAKMLADALAVPVNEIMKKLLQMGVMVNMNITLPFEQVELIALDYSVEVKNEKKGTLENFENINVEDDPKDLILRAPVVTIMGHVDHGKTTLLDTIRKANVAEGEAGGITQAISAYQVEVEGKKITFIDTPGHEAFTEMRARGSKITDIIVIIIAADDGVMPQTKEVIDHAKAAGVPIIIALNKMDKPGIKIEKIKTELAEYGLAPEEFGGDTLYSEISALTGMGVDDLLSKISLLAELAELKANPKRYATGSVIEARLDNKKGVIATLLVQNGTLRLGDPLIVGNYYGKVRTILNDAGKEIASAGPSEPVEIMGLSDVPSAGDKFMAFESEKEAKAIADKRKTTAKLEGFKNQKGASLDDLFSNIQSGVKELRVIVKTDVKGSCEAVKGSLAKIDVEGAKVSVISNGCGAITEGDIILAKASDAIVLGFNVRPDNKMSDFAKENGVEVRLYSIIYKLIEDIEAAMKGSLDPIYEEKVLGEAEVRKTFKFSKVGVIAGSYIRSGLIKRNAKARIIRDGVVIYDGEIGSLQKEKDSAKEVKKGMECGITIENFNDIKEGDVIEAYELIEVKRWV